MKQSVICFAPDEVKRLMQDTIITILAVWGAVVATSVAVWDVIKFRREKRAQLTIFATGGMIIVQDPSDEKYISVIVTNIGSRPTTLQQLTYRYFKVKPSSFKEQPDERGVFNLFTPLPMQKVAPLPKKLDVGEVWREIVIQSVEIERMVKEGYFYIEMEHSLEPNSLKFPRVQLFLSES